MEVHSQSYWQEQTEQREERDRQARLARPAGQARLIEFSEIVQSLSPWQRRLLLVSLYYLLALGNLRRFLRI